MTSKMPGDTVRPVSAARSGCATLPSFRPLASAKARAAASIAGDRPVVEAAEDLGEVGDALPRASGVSCSAAAASIAIGRDGVDELREVDELEHGLGARLQLGQGGEHGVLVGGEARRRRSARPTSAAVASITS